MLFFFCANSFHIFVVLIPFSRGWSLPLYQTILPQRLLGQSFLFLFLSCNFFVTFILPWTFFFFFFGLFIPGRGLLTWLCQKVAQLARLFEFSFDWCFWVGGIRVVCIFPLLWSFLSYACVFGSVLSVCWHLYNHVGCPSGICSVSAKLWNSSRAYIRDLYQCKPASQDRFLAHLTGIRINCSDFGRRQALFIIYMGIYLHVKEKGEHLE